MEQAWNPAVLTPSPGPSAQNRSLNSELFSPPLSYTPKRSWCNQGCILSLYLPGPCYYGEIVREPSCLADPRGFAVCHCNSSGASSSSDLGYGHCHTRTRFSDGLTFQTSESELLLKTLEYLLVSGQLLCDRRFAW